MAHEQQATGATFGVAPVLAGLAAAAAAIDLLGTRIALRASHASFSRDLVLELERWGDVAANAAGLAAWVALAVSAVHFVRRRGAIPSSARVGILTSGSILIAMAAMILLLPRAATRPESIIVFCGTASALMLFCGITGLSAGPGPLLGATLGLAIFATASGTIGLGSELLGHALSQPATRIVDAVYAAGEITYWLVPIVGGLAAAPRLRETHGRAAAVVSMVVAATTAATFLWWHFSQGQGFNNLFYGAFHAALFAGRSVWYGAPLAIGAALGVAGLIAPDGARRQIGLAVLLWLSAGYAPRSPLLLMLAALSVVLVARAAIGQRAARSR